MINKYDDFAVMNSIVFAVSVVNFQMFQHCFVVMSTVFFFSFKTGIGMVELVFVS